MEYKRIVTEEEKEIIEKGDQGKPFSNLEEAEIYLRNLINNRKYYIEQGLKKYNEKLKDTVGASLFITIFLAAMASVGSGILELGAGLAIWKIAGGISALIIGSIPVGRFLEKRKITKQINYNIQALKVKCGFIDEDQLAFEEIKATMKKEQISKQRVDGFIINIRDDMYKVAEIKYPGYEQDLEELCALAENYLEAKQKLGTTSDSYALSQDPKWFNTLLEIESRIQKRSKVREDQETNMEVLDQIKEALRQEKIDLQNISNQTTSNENMTTTGPTLKIEGK